MALKEIIGQERALGILQGCIERDRVPHALLFAGDEGIGKKLAAINFAKTLNCRGKEQGAEGAEETSLDFGFFPPEPQSVETNPKSQIPDTLPDSCDVCPSCVKIDKSNHPDVFVVGPEGDGDQITVSVIREIEEALSYKPFEGRWKIAIIDNADKMNQAASNALLATLEAPPGQSMLILISSRPDMLLATIRSRCQRINFSPLPLEVMSSLLLEKSKKMERQKALLLSTLSGGKLGHALDEDLIARRDKAFSILKQMLLVPGDDIKGETDSLEELFDWAQVWLRDIAVFMATGREEYLINTDLIHDIRTASAGAELKDILKLAQELYNIRGNLKFNLNEKLTKNYTSFMIRKRLGRIDAGK